MLPEKHIPQGLGMFTRDFSWALFFGLCWQQQSMINGCQCEYSEEYLCKFWMCCKKLVKMMFFLYIFCLFVYLCEASFNSILVFIERTQTNWWKIHSHTHHARTMIDGSHAYVQYSFWLRNISLLQLFWLSSTMRASKGGWEWDGIERMD